MRLSLESSPRWSGLFLALLAVYIVWVGGVVVVHRYNTTAEQPILLCQFRRVTGYPCPTCGGTRRGTNLLSGDLVGAATDNPLLAALLIIASILVVLRIVAGRTIRATMSRPERRAAWALVVTVVLANWAWVLSQHLER